MGRQWILPRRAWVKSVPRLHFAIACLLDGNGRGQMRVPTQPGADTSFDIDKAMTDRPQTYRDLLIIKPTAWSHDTGCGAIVTMCQIFPTLSCQRDHAAQRRNFTSGSASHRIDGAHEIVHLLSA